MPGRVGSSPPRDGVGQQAVHQRPARDDRRSDGSPPRPACPPPAGARPRSAPSSARPPARGSTPASGWGAPRAPGRPPAGGAWGAPRDRPSPARRRSAAAPRRGCRPPPASRRPRPGAARPPPARPPAARAAGRSASSSSSASFRRPSTIRTAPMVIPQSATLKAGQRSKSRKSVTAPWTRRSIRLPRLPPTSRPAPAATSRVARDQPGERDRDRRQRDHRQHGDDRLAPREEAEGDALVGHPRDREPGDHLDDLARRRAGPG